MQKFSISNISCDYVYGFDLDGTLYDEFDFISQVYVGVAKFISSIVQVDEDTIYKRICRLWLQYGSSKRDLFQTFFTEVGVVPETELIKECIKIFRTTDFKLHLPMRSEMILDLIRKTGANMFLLTDGNSILQRRKIHSLGIEKWFTESQIFISGDYGAEYQKPNTLIRPAIEKEIIDLSKVIYFGDREIDEEFAEKMHFDFCKTFLMNVVD